MEFGLLRAAGIAMICLGAALLVGPSFGFQQIDADRSVVADVAQDEANALLGLQPDYDGTEIEYSPTPLPWQEDTVVNATVANLTNNVDEALAVSVLVESVDWGGGDDRVLEVSNGDDFGASIGSGASQEVVVGCSREVTGEASDATVRLSFQASGSEVSIDRTEFPVSGVSFNCEGSSSPGDGSPPTDPIPIDDPDVNLEVVGTPSAELTGGWFADYSVVTFDLENTGSDSVTVSAIHLSEASSGSTLQRGGSEVDVTASSDGDLDASDGISIDPDAPRYDFDQNATLDAGATASVELGQFREGSNSWEQVDMRGESVTLVLYVDGLDVAGRDDPVPVEIELDVEE